MFAFNLLSFHLWVSEVARLIHLVHLLFGQIIINSYVCLIKGVVQIEFIIFRFCQKYTGVLHLPAISGPDESELIFCILCFVSAYVGDDILSDLKINLGFGE